MPNMDSLVGIGVIVNFLYSLWNTILVFQGQTHMVHHLYFESSAIIILFVKIGRYIDSRNKSKANGVTYEFLEELPETAKPFRKYKNKRFENLYYDFERDKIILFNDIKNFICQLCFFFFFIWCERSFDI